MSFPTTLTKELERLGCSATGQLAYSLPSGPGTVSWHVSFRALGFAKNQIDGSLRYRHPKATPFGWHCLTHYAGDRWSRSAHARSQSLSAGFAMGAVAAWRTDFTLDNVGLSPEEAASKVASDLQTKVLPFLARLQTDSDLLRFLEKDEEPYPWFRSQGLARLAEIAVLGTGQNESTGKVLALAEHFSPMLQEQLSEVELQQYIHSVLSAARGEA